MPRACRNRDKHSCQCDAHCRTVACDSPPARVLNSTPTPIATTLFLYPPASAEGEWECKESTSGGARTRTCAPLSPHKPVCYEDLDYGFAMAYPANFKVTISINVVSPRDPGVIVRRHEIFGPTAAVDLDIWRSSEPDLTTWLERMRRTGGAGDEKMFPRMEPNGRVGGRPAIAFIEGLESYHQMFTVFFSNGPHFYRLWYTMSCHEEGLSTVRRMLDSIRFSPDPVEAEIPEAVWQQAQEVCGRSFSFPCPHKGPTPTPLPVALPDAAAVRDRTAKWLVYENPEWGIRFRYPPEWEVTEEISQQDPLNGYLGVARVTEEGYREFLMVFFISRLPEVRLGEGIDVWIRSLSGFRFADPESSVYVVGLVEGPGWKGWHIQEVGPGYPPVRSRVVIPGREVVIVADIGSTTWPPQESWLNQALPQQMAILATLEIAR